MTKTSEHKQQAGAGEWLDEMTFKAQRTIEQGKQRSNILRGEREKTRGTAAWARKQKTKADRQETQATTQEIRLEEDKIKQQVAKDDRDYMKVYQPIHRTQLTQQLVKKSYKIGAHPDQFQGKEKQTIAPSTAQVVEFASTKATAKVE